jgi:predicted GIY-YIG superfamily endonuclease
MACCVYALCDPSTGEIRYIGIAQSTRYRLQTHISRAKKGKTHKDRWVAKLLRNGTKPAQETLRRCATEAEALAWEASFIALLRDAGYRLTNFTDGGDGTVTGKTWKLTDEQRANISAGRKKHFANKRARGEQIVAPNKGKKVSPETRRKISEARRGKPGHPHTEEFKAQLAERNSKRVWTPEQRAKASASAKARHARRRAEQEGG